MRLDGERSSHLEDPMGLIEGEVGVGVDGQVQHGDEMERMSGGGK
jgi:hypothetical protein